MRGTEDEDAARGAEVEGLVGPGRARARVGVARVPELSC